MVLPSTRLELSFTSECGRVVKSFSSVFPESGVSDFCHFLLVTRSERTAPRWRFCIGVSGRVVCPFLLFAFLTRICVRSIFLFLGALASSWPSLGYRLGGRGAVFFRVFALSALYLFSLLTQRVLSRDPCIRKQTTPLRILQLSHTFSCLHFLVCSAIFA